MARSLDSSVVAQLTQPGIRLVHLLKLQTSTSILTTTHVKDLVYDSGSGNETYYAGGNLIELETVRESGDMEYQNLNISLNNISTTTRDMFKGENYVNKAADIYIGITFIIWNNHGYQEISTSMQAVGVDPIGCDPKPPLFEDIAKAYGIPFQRCDHIKGATKTAINLAKQSTGPSMIEVVDAGKTKA